VEAISFSSRLVYSVYLISYEVSINFKHITFLEILSMMSSLKPSMLEIVSVDAKTRGMVTLNLLFISAFYDK
jgi:hypothetical protein